MPSEEKALQIVAAEADAELVVFEEGLSFWGGVDPDCGVVIDTHHPQCGRSLAGKIVLMPTSRGSCSGSGVLLQLALNGCAPAALMFCEDEEVLTLGALIASHMFDRHIGIVRLPKPAYETLKSRTMAKLRGTYLRADDFGIDLLPVSQSALELSPRDQAMRDGEMGKPVSLAMQVIQAMGASQGARCLIDVTRGHVDGCIYAHDANLIFAETMAEMGAKVAIPTTINAISVDHENWQNHNLPPKFGQAASRLADAYVRMGARPTFTCAPYLAEGAPQEGEPIGWSESNAVIFANSVLGARTAKHPDYLDLFIALTGRAPETGVYLTRNRQPGIVIDVAAPEGHDDAFWPLLGWLSGKYAPDRVPRIEGLETTRPSRDDLRAMCAAFGTTSAAPLLHVAGVTPEGNLEPLQDAGRVRIDQADLARAWRALNAGPARVDLIALGSPHFSLEETRALAHLMEGKTTDPATDLIIALGRDVLAQARVEGLVDMLHAAGATIHADMCWCSIVEPVFPPHARTVMTNSGKYAHYAPGLCGRAVRFGSLSDCAMAAQTGHAPIGLPEWLRPNAGAAASFT